MLFFKVTLMCWSQPQIKLASRQAGISTASMGKFDRKLRGEKEGERAPVGKRRKFLDVTDVSTERAKMGGMADKFLRERCAQAVSGVQALVYKPGFSQAAYTWGFKVAALCLIYVLLAVVLATHCCCHRLSVHHPFMKCKNYCLQQLPLPPIP